MLHDVSVKSGGNPVVSVKSGGNPVVSVKSGGNPEYSRILGRSEETTKLKAVKFRVGSHVAKSGFMCSCVGKAF